MRNGKYILYIFPPSQVHAVPPGEGERRVGRPRRVRRRRQLPVLPHAHGAAVSPGDLQVHQVQRHPEHVILSQGGVLRVRTR